MTVTLSFARSGDATLIVPVQVVSERSTGPPPSTEPGSAAGPSTGPARAATHLSHLPPSVRRVTASRTRPPRPAYRCGECGAAVPRWVGRCPECQAWGSVAEARTERVGTRVAAPQAVSAAARPIPEIDADAAMARPTGVGELDRVLGGGIVPGSVVLLAGEPGVGKSTLLLEVAARCARPAAPTLYVTGRSRSGRSGCGPAAPARSTRCSTSQPRPTSARSSPTSTRYVPGLVVVDSVQTVADGTVEGAAGGVTQVRSVAAALTAVAKERGIATVLVAT